MNYRILNNGELSIYQFVNNQLSNSIIEILYSYSSPSPSRSLSPCRHHRWFYFCTYSAVDTAGKTPPAGASKAAKPSTTTSIMRFMAPKLLASTHAAADRRFVIWSAVNMRAQNMRHDEGYKLHVGALCPEYVETTMFTQTFNSILSTVYTETCDEVKKGLRLQRESCVKVGYLGPFLGAQLDLTTVANEEYITFSVSYIAEGETEITRVGLATRAFPGSHTAADIEPWIEKASVNNIKSFHL